MRHIALFAGLLMAAGTASGITLNANATANNGGSAGWGIFFDLQGPSGYVVTQLSTASTAAAGATFTVELFTRNGTALGGPVGSGPGSSSAGWTSIGTVTATQGATSSGISQLINIPDIPMSNSIVGVAMVFTGAGPRYFGTGTGAPQVFSDGTLTLTTGDSRSAPFTTTGSWFSPRGLTGVIEYEIPEPGSLTALATLALFRRRR